MNRKILYIILVALAVLLLVALLWWWFLRREATNVQTTGSFGTAQNAQNGTGATSAGGDTNIGTALPGQTTDQQTQTNVDLGSVGGNSQNQGVPQGTSTVFVTEVQGQVGVPGVTWLSGVPGGTSVSGGGTVANNGPGTVFNPIGINPIAQSNPSGNGGVLPNINTNAYGQQQTSGGGSSALGSVATAAGVGVVTCAIVPAIQFAAQSLGFTEGTAKQVTAQKVADGLMTEEIARAVSTVDLSENVRFQIGTSLLSGEIARATANQTGQQNIDQFLGCMARNIAKIMLQQITVSVVNWINSGFNGSPAFVQNPTRFLQQTADQVAGNYIQSSALSFLCSPFQLQIRIAIAQSYANRDANSCTLTQVTNNINNFMRGSFSSSGGWPAFLSFVNVPTNNPYGAFVYGSVGLQTATTKAKDQVQTDLLQGSGFLSFQQKQNCRQAATPPATVGANTYVSKAADGFGPSNNPKAPDQPLYTVCDWVSTTPGKIIESSLESTFKSSLDQIGLAKSFDEIISALINQLMTRALQGGVSNLSGAGGYESNFYSTDQLQSQELGQGLVTQMQQDTNTAASYASIQQGSIQDIQDAQSRLNDLVNCWGGIASSSPNAGSAASNAAQASATLNSLNALVNGYNNRITLANGAIVALQNLQSRALSAGSSADINAVQSDYNSAKAAGQLVTQTDVTNAQQNRTTLQSQMATLNQQTSSSLNQCHAQ
jgi:hypothetical protein